MTIDESNLTAYALGELSGTQRTAVAAHLAGNADARRYVAEIRATANVLADELARESFGGMTDTQHVAIEEKLEEAIRLPIDQARRKQQSRWNRTVFAMRLAAAVLIVCGVASVLIAIAHRHENRSDTRHAAVQKPEPGSSFVQINPGIEPPQLPGGVIAPPDSQQHMVAAHDDGNEEIDTQWLPQPDNQLVKRGSGREEMADTLKPAPVGPSVARVVPEPVVDPHLAHGSPEAGGPHDPAPSSTDANLPLDQRSPDKTPTNVERSPDGKLPDGDQYAHLLENPFIDTATEPVSGFSAGVDTASYSNIRRFLTHGKLPPHDAVRIEEMLNYFPVRSADPSGDGPLVLQVELGACPWRPDLRLARVCVQARELPPSIRPAVNLVLLIDVSDSMRNEKAKLPMLKQAMHLLAGRLSSRDHIAIIAYKYEPGIVLATTTANDKTAIRAAIDRLETGGKVAGGQGIEAAYELARQGFIPGGANRVILATDGNWNVGVTNRDQVVAIARDQAGKHVSLTVLGVGMENLKDATLQQLAAAGNGSYAYIDTLAEAKKVLIDQINGALVPRARDVKVQVSFNRAAANSYRLLGYERRGLTKDELASHSKLGGELGAGQSVTALYEVFPAGKSSTTHPADLMTTAVTYVDPTTEAPGSIVSIGEDHGTPLPSTSTEFRFAAAVAEFGLVLRDSDHKGNATYSSILYHLQEATGPDATGYRREFSHLVEKAKALSVRP